MKKFFILFCLIISCSNPTENNEIDSKIDLQISQMTLKEKIGQMAQINLTVITEGPDKWSSFEPIKLDSKKLRKAILEYKIGSVLNTANNQARKPELWNKIIGEIQNVAINESRLGIPVIYGIDAIHGATYTDGATMFPQQITTAASWNTENAYNMAKVTAYEIKACGIPWNFSPVLDLGQDPRFPRQFETFGEDPYITTQMGMEMVRGYQGNENKISNSENVATCIKHFLGYQTTITGKDRTPSYIPEHVLREIHLPSFKSAIEMGAKSIMINSGLINGIPTHADKYILTTLLRDELGFEGVILTDWEDINKLHDRDKVAATRKEAIKIAINAGIDMSMIPYDYEEFCDKLFELVNENLVSISRINESVKRILKLKYELNLFETPLTDYNNYEDFGSEKFAKLAYKSASEGITLLKNTNSILPLKENLKILVTGPNGNSMRTLNGAWTYSWQGEKTEKFAQKHNTIYESISNIYGKKNVKFVSGVEYPFNADFDKEPKFQYYDQNEKNFNKAISEAKKSDVIILCLGENTYTEKPGDLNDLNLHRLQKKLAIKLAETGKPIILIINSGRPRLITDIEPLMASVVNIYLPGNYGGDALADIISGKVNPSGKLPYTYPLFPNSLTTYNYKPAEIQNNSQGAYNYVGEINSLYEFGFGLSYTNFKYENLKLNDSIFNKNENIAISIKVTNIGKRIGKETIQLYSKDHYASLTPDIKRLRRFKKIELSPGESKVVNFKLPVSELSFINEKNISIVEPGNFDLIISNLNKTIEVK
jgi:beta-glucosidase